jgi:hypothetical protein
MHYRYLRNECTTDIVTTISTSTEEGTEKECYLLELPRELRDIIIEETLTIAIHGLQVSGSNEQHIHADCLRIIESSTMRGDIADILQH